MTEEKKPQGLEELISELGAQESLPTSSTAEMPLSESPLSPDDQKYHDQLPPALQLTCRRHGVKLMKLVMTGGISSMALGKIARRNAGNREMLHAVAILQRELDGLVKIGVREAGKELKDFMECRTDVERIGAIATAASQGEQRTKSGLIIQH